MTQERSEQILWEAEFNERVTKCWLLGDTVLRTEDKLTRQDP